MWLSCSVFELVNFTIIEVINLIGFLLQLLAYIKIFNKFGNNIKNNANLYIFFGIMVGQLKSSWVTSFEMIECIRNGGLNKYLMRPVSFFSYHFEQELQRMYKLSLQLTSQKYTVQKILRHQET
mgnify:CR=1 FL=1